MNKLKVLSAISCVALLGLMSASFADSNDCSSVISSATAACLSQDATQQYMNNFNNYFATAQSMSQFENPNIAQQSAPSTMQAAQPANNQVQHPPAVNSNSPAANTNSYVAPLISNSTSKDKSKINWF